MQVKQEFRVNDIVRFIPMGDKEYILQNSSLVTYPLEIEELGKFTSDGRISTSHINPLLILIRRPEEKKKWYQVFYKYKNALAPEASLMLYNSEEDFYSRGIKKDKLEWMELKFVCER